MCFLRRLALAVSIATLLSGTVLAGAATAQTPGSATTLTPAGYRALTLSTALAERERAEVERAERTPSLVDDRRALRRAMRDCRRLGDSPNAEVRVQREMCVAGSRAALTYLRAAAACERRPGLRALDCLAAATEAMTIRLARVVEAGRRFGERLAPGGCRTLLAESASDGEAALAVLRLTADAFRRHDVRALEAALRAYDRVLRRSERLLDSYPTRQTACDPARG